MKCPKCGQVQEESPVCSQCGIVIAKYQAFLEQEGQSQSYTSPPRASRSGFPLIPVVMGMLVAGSAVYYFMSPSTSGKAIPVVSELPEQSAKTATEAAFNGLDIDKQLKETAPAANVVEQARNATVFVKTSWGTGSGFFVSRDCRVVTNKHVVKVNENKLDRAENNVENWKQQLEQARADLERRKKDFRRSCRGCNKQQYQLYVGQYEDRLTEMEARLEKFDMAVTEVKTEEDFIIILSDGTELEVYLDQSSLNHDLALLKLRSLARCPVIPVSQQHILNQGQRLYTIGSPIGIKHVVTSGIFSGYTKVGEELMLQTDAPINPGNSGGPLINEKGEIVGINTAVARKAEGIGFAIPIDVALNEFGL